MRVEDSWSQLRSEMRNKMDFVGRRARKGREKRETPESIRGGLYTLRWRGAGDGQMAIIVVSNLPSITASSHQVSSTHQPYPPLPTYQPTCGGKAGSKGSKENNSSEEKETIDDLPYC
jgi:hypothetical protein